MGGGGGVGEAGAQLQAAQHRRVGQVEVAPHLQACQGKGPSLYRSNSQLQSLKGLSHEIDFKNFD